MTPSTPPHARAVVPTWAAALATLALSCLSAGASPVAPPPARQGDGAAAPATSIVTHALLINGGGTRESNVGSHVAHLRRLLGLLDRAGVPASRVHVFSSDGKNPAADLAVREAEPDAFWLIERTALGDRLRPPLTFVDSQLPAPVAPRPATRAELARWFATTGAKLQPGDTLLLYVTDHGLGADRDPLGNRIVLWGQNETLSVRQLRTMLGGLPRGVRVVSLMSQCFSGGFGRLVDARTTPDGQPSGETCGYFASTPDRPAYGCYAESADRDEVGHSFEIFQSLAADGSLRTAHERALVSDRTPDVPLRSSDLFLETELERRAKPEGGGLAFTGYVDRLLGEAFRDRARYEPELRLLDRIGHAYGMTSPRTLRALEEQTQLLGSLLAQLESHRDAWDNALGDLSMANLERFVAAKAHWRERFAKLPAKLPAPERARITSEVLGELAPFTEADAGRAERLVTVRERGDRAGEAAYRLEVRLAALLRMRAVLLRIAGRQRLMQPDAAPAAAALARLERCEDLRLPKAPGAPPPPAPETYPPFDEELALAREVLPAWLGIRFDALRPARQAQLGVGHGAAHVVNVFPESPAHTAGLRPGDVVLGPPGAPFSDPNEIRTWTMLSRIDEPRPLEVLRDGARVAVTIVPKPLPVKWPELPGPPRVGTVAPAVLGASFRGTPATKLATGSRLLFFWATWCAPCKASLPALLAYEAEKRVPVVAITDEPPADLRAFFARWKQPFPANVVSDEDRATFGAYGVSGTPTFVLVGPDNKVAAYGVGYDPGKGLPLPAR